MGLKYNSYLADIESNLLNNPRDFWKFINNKRINHGYPPQMNYNGTCAVDSSEFSDPYCFRSILYALAISVIEYARQVWSPFYAIDISRIELNST